MLYLANHPGTDAANYFMNGFDLWGMGPDRGTVIGGARPEKVEIARKVGFTVAVLDGDGNRYVTEAGQAPSAEAWDRVLRERVDAARAAWQLAELGASRAPRSRVRVDAACVKRASARTTPCNVNEHQAP